MPNPNLKPGAAGKPAPLGGLRPDTVALEVVCHPRCMPHGLKIMGRHFTDKPLVLKVSDLEIRRRRRLLSHPELSVKQLSSAPAERKPEPEVPVKRSPTEYAKTDAPSDDVKPRRRRKKVEE